MMKKLILNSLVVTMLLGGAVTAFAQDTNTIQTDTTMKATAPRPIKAVLEAKLEARKENRASTTMELKQRMASSSEVRKENREDRREDRREKVKNAIEKRFRKMFQRFQATIDRETMIMGKINTRIEKVKTAGGTTTESEKYTAEAKLYLGEAQVALNLLKSTATSTAEIDAQVNASSTTPTTTPVTLKKMQKIGADVEKNIRNAHKALENALKSLKGMSSVNVNASTTTNN